MLDFDEEGRKVAGYGHTFNDLDVIWTSNLTGGTIYCGNRNAAGNMAVLKSRHITHIVNCTSGPTKILNHFPEYLQYYEFPISEWKLLLKDESDDAVFDFISPLIAFVDAAMNDCGNVLLHCSVGAHRAGSTCCLLLMHYENLNVLAAVKRAKERRNIIEPMAHLLVLLRKYELNQKRGLRIDDDEDEDEKSLDMRGTSHQPIKSSSSIVISSPDWLDSRNPHFLANEDRSRHILQAKEDRSNNQFRIPKKVKVGTPINLVDTPTHMKSDTKRRETMEDTILKDLRAQSSKKLGSKFFKDIGDKTTLLDTTRRFFIKDKVKEEDLRDARRQQRDYKPLCKKTRVVVVESEEDDSDESVDEPNQYEDAELTVSDIKSKAQRVFATCEKYSADLQRELRAWEGESARSDIVCVDLTSIRSSSRVILAEQDFVSICPGLALKPYQLVGVNWLKLLHESNVNGCLCDDMGLGKTVQTISFLGYLKRERGGCSNKVKPHLIVVPASTLANWQNEFERFCPSLIVFTYHGSQNERYEHRQEMRAQFERGGIDVILTTYTMFERESSADDRKFLHALALEYLVLDEAHSIKNSSSSRFVQLNRLRTKHRLLISGTPVQNDLSELLALLSFLMPDVFRQSDCEILLEAFGHNKKEKGKSGPEGSSSLISITKMRNVLAPFVLRRLKKDVLNQLVDKTLKTVRLEVTTSQRDLYFGIMQSYALKKARAKEQDEDQGFIVDGVHMANILANNSRRLEGEGKEQNKRDELIDLSRDELDTVLKRELTASEANHLFTALRKAANHPLLLRVRYDNDALAQIANVSFQMGHFGRQCDLKMVTNELESFSDFDLHQICGQYDTYLGHKILDESCLYDSPKMVWLRENIPILMAKGHRMLIFSQWTRLLDLLEVLLEDMCVHFLRLDGSTPVGERQGLINRFNTEPIPVFLLSTKAGGLGINLTAADVVIMHDLDFNPENDRQAEDRCHRIGQTKPVFVYKLVCVDTVDEDIMEMGERKRLLSDAVLSKNDGNGPALGDIAQILHRALEKRLAAN